MLLLAFSGLSIHHCLQLFAGILIWWLFVVVLELQIPLPRRVQEWLKRMLRGLSFICPRFHDTCARHEQLKLGCSMTRPVFCHGVDPSACCTNTVIPSRYYRTIIRWLHDDIASASRIRVTFVRQSSSFLFPSYCLRESKNATDTTDDHTK